jgi:hypothetical protein
MRPSLVHRHGVRLACMSFAVAAAGPALSFGATTGASHPAVSLSGPHYHRAGRHPSSVAVADLNGDRKRDLAVANESGTVSVLLNLGGGRFKNRRQFRAGRGPASVVIANFDGDHKPDLAVANSGASSVSILLNKGAGRFAPKRDYRTGPEPVDIAAGDLNGDRRPDLITANGTVSVLINEGGGSFRPKVDYELRPDSYVSSVAIADLNGDGKADLVAADPLSVFLGTGDGGFEARRDYTSFGESLVLADLNGDGKPDLVAGGDLTVSVAFNRGDGTFTPRRNYPSGTWAQSIAVGDLNRDGRPDVVTTDAIAPNQEDCDTGDGFEISVLPNKGHGRLGRPLSFSTYYDGCDPASSAIADVTGDGKPDVVTANHFSGTASVLVNAVGRCAVPDLTLDGNYPLAAAKRILIAAGCRPGKLRYVYTRSRDPRAYVIGQRPRWGAVLRRGGVVDLVVSKGRRR